jgi:hypothetical protein
MAVDGEGNVKVADSGLFSIKEYQPGLQTLQSKRMAVGLR